MKKPISAKQQRPSSWLQPSKRLQAQHDTLRQMPNLKRNEFALLWHYVIGVLVLLLMPYDLH